MDNSATVAPLSAVETQGQPSDGITITQKGIGGTLVVGSRDTSSSIIRNLVTGDGYFIEAKEGMGSYHIAISDRSNLPSEIIALEVMLGDGNIRRSSNTYVRPMIVDFPHGWTMEGLGHSVPGQYSGIILTFSDDADRSNLQPAIAAIDRIVLDAYNALPGDAGPGR